MSLTHFEKKLPRSTKGKCAVGTNWALTKQHEPKVTFFVFFFLNAGRNRLDSRDGRQF